MRGSENNEVGLEQEFSLQQILSPCCLFLGENYALLSNAYKKSGVGGSSLGTGDFEWENSWQRKEQVSFSFWGSFAQNYSFRSLLFMFLKYVWYF